MSKSDKTMKAARRRLAGSEIYDDGKHITESSTIGVRGDIDAVMHDADATIATLRERLKDASIAHGKVLGEIVALREEVSGIHAELTTVLLHSSDGRNAIGLIRNIKEHIAAQAAEIERLRGVVEEHKRVTHRANKKSGRKTRLAAAVRAEKAALAARVAELEGVVGNLPVTADGVRAYPGMEVWRRAYKDVYEQRELELYDLEDMGHCDGEIYHASKSFSTEAAARAAAEQQGPDCSKCPNCGGPADNGHSRDVPPKPYYCTNCAAAEQR